jgi:cytochrome c-type biogenesis protein CcmE
MSTPGNITGNSFDQVAAKSPAASPLAPSGKRRQRGRAILLVASVGLVLGLIGYAVSDTQSFEYYKHVDEVMRDPAAWRDKRLQLHGFVVPGSIMKRIDRDRQKLEYKFRVENCGAITEARFAGVVPDTFKEGAEVVLKGQLQGDGFHTSEVMAKCPSKYAQEGAQKSAMITRCSREGAAAESGASAQRMN